MNNPRHILMHIHAVLGSTKKTERDVDDFCTWIEVQVMTELMEALPTNKQNQVIDQFLALPPDKKESAFYPSPFNIVIAGRAARTSTHDRRFRIRCLEAVLLCDHIEIGRGNVSTHVERAGLKAFEHAQAPPGRA